MLQTHDYNSDLIAIMTPQNGVGITPASVTFRLPRPVASLGHQEGRKICLRGAQWPN